MTEKVGETGAYIGHASLTLPPLYTIRGGKSLNFPKKAEKNNSTIVVEARRRRRRQLEFI